MAALACSLNAWLRHIGLDGRPARAEPKALRYRLLGAPARHVVHARRATLKIPPGWPWAHDLATAYQRLHALHPPDPANPTPTRHTTRPDRGTRRPPEHPRTANRARTRSTTRHSCHTQTVMNSNTQMNDQDLPPGYPLYAWLIGTAHSLNAVVTGSLATTEAARPPAEGGHLRTVQRGGGSAAPGIVPL
jgi:hypothetical protein